MISAFLVGSMPEVSAKERWLVERFDKCWEVRECRKREECKVYPHFGRSCWLIREKLKKVLEIDELAGCPSDCATCEVYEWQMAFLNLGVAQNGRSRRG